MFYSADLNPRDSLSDSLEGLFQRGKGGARKKWEFFGKKAQNAQVVGTS